MKTAIREGVFETNSSSTHSLIMLEESKFNEWKDGEIFYHEGEPWIKDKEAREKFRNYFKKYDNHDDFFTKEEVKEIKKFCIDNDIKVEENNYENWDYAFQTYDRWLQLDDLESEVYTHTTPGGEKIVAVAKYGFC